MTYIHMNPGAGKPLLLFLHGFADSARSLLRRAYPEPSENYEILAINGPFPVPQKKGDEWKHAFAWYFADFSKGTVYIPPQVSAKAVTDLLSHLNLQNREKMLIAFSQGGFFMPHLLPHLHKLRHAVVIGAAYRPEDYPEKPDVTVDALHGGEDEVIPVARAEESFAKLAGKNPHGVFTRFEGLKHTMNDESRLFLKNKIESVFRK